MASLAVIIVNWNTGDQLRDCLATVGLARDSIALDRVVVVDNASTDDSIDRLPEIGVPVVVMRNDRNRGFAAACNQGAAAAAHVDFLLFLNPDTRLEPDSLRVPLAALAEPSQATVGICGIQLTDEDGGVSPSCARFPTARRIVGAALGLTHLTPWLVRGHFLTEWDHDSDGDVDQVMGAFFLVRGPLFRELHGFDERFFVYFEEVDFALRARQAGWRSWYCARAKAHHRGGGASHQIRGRRLFYVLRSRLLYAAKHFHWGAAALVFLVTILVEPASRCALALLRRGVTGARETWTGYRLLWSAVPQILRRTAGHNAA